jgi:CRP-like cAMP-binding protein
VALARAGGLAVPNVRGELRPKNRLLAALPANDLLSLRPHLEAVPLAQGCVLLDANAPLTRIHFVENGVASLLTVLENHAPVGVATVGREGAVGVATLLLGGESALGRYQMLVPGSGLAVDVPPFRRALRESARLSAACEAYTRALFVQVLQAVPCARLHTVEQRCARWLLMCADRTEEGTVEITEECLAAILAVPPSTMTAVVCSLQQAGLIRYRRGTITVLDRRGLEAGACECYRIIRDRYERLLPRTSA